MNDSAGIGVQRHELKLAKYHDGRTPDDGEPDEVEVFVVWTAPDGTKITDDERIAALEASLEKE